MAEIGKRLGRKALEQIAWVAKPDTVLGWYRKLIAQKFEGSASRAYPGRPRVDRKTEDLIVQLARENPTWGYDRIVGALTNLAHSVSSEAVGSILRHNGVSPAPKRSQTIHWKDFIAAHMSVMAGIDFFTVEFLTWRGLATYYILFLVHVETRRVRLAGITRHPTEDRMQQMARNMTDPETGAVWSEAVDTPSQVTQLESFAEGWVRSAKDECRRIA